MSRTASTFGKQATLNSSSKGLGDLSGSLRRSGSLNGLRKSTGNLAASFNSTSGKSSKNNNELERIEAEYIKNLQQQVYFLELEANYLREQARKATELHPQMTSEAERMLNKLRQMQAEFDGMQIEVKRKESSLDLANTEKERLCSRLKAEEDSHQREKRLLLDEIVQLKKEKELMERDNSRKDGQILHAREELDKSASSIRAAETQIQMLRNQLDQREEQLKLTKTALEEKRTELLKTETNLREMEEKYYSSTAALQEKLLPDLREEVRLLRQKLKEAEMNADQDRYLRNKLSDDSSHLVKENALLNQQVLELQKQLEREKELRDSQESRRSLNISELVAVKERERTLQVELNQAQDQLKQQQSRLNHYMQQLAKQEQVSTSQEYNFSTTRSKLAEVEGLFHSRDAENAELRRDKMLLVDHVADIQRQLEAKEKEIVGLRAHIHSLETRLKDLEHLKDLESSVHSQKWEEFSRLADSMKHLSRTMARTASPKHSTSKVAEYS